MDAGQDRPRLPQPGASKSTLAARWPAHAQGLLGTSLALCIEHLRAPLRACLAQFAQYLFDLADRTHLDGDRQSLLTWRERIVKDQTALEQRFVTQLTRNFDQVDAPAAPTQGDAGTTWHQLELLDPVESELATTLDQLGTRGDRRHSSVLHELGYRLAVLIGFPPLENDALPLGPRALAQAFHRASLSLELPLEYQVQLLHVFDRTVIHSLETVYARVNAHLQQDGILPQLRNIPLPCYPSRPIATPADADTRYRAEAVVSEPVDVIESLRNLLAQPRGISGAHASHRPGERVAGTEELQTALGTVQQHLGQVTDRASGELRSAARLREKLLTQLNVGKQPGALQTALTGEQGDTVELVTMPFEQLGKQLQGGGSALPDNLQLPVLPMATADRGFFEQRQHPARQLLDTVTSAANEWLDGSDDDATRLLASKLEHLVTRASEEPPSNGLYTVLLADIEHHLALLNRSAKAAERRHIEAAQGRERLDLARARAGELMAQRFAQSAPRGLLRALLDRAWSDVLALTLLRHGEDSDAFGEQLGVTDQLLGRLPMGDRARLQQDVEAGLQQIGMHTEEAIQVAQRLLNVTPGIGGADQPRTTDLVLRLKQHQRLGETASTESAPPASVVAANKPAEETVYAKVNAHLQQDGILPQLRSMSLPRRPSRPITTPADADTPYRAEPAASEPVEVFESLRNLLTQPRDISGAHATYRPDERGLDGSDAAAMRLLVSKLEHPMTRASEEPPSNGLHAMLLADIEHQLALLNRKAKAAERRHIEAPKDRERLDYARRRAGELMAQRFVQSAPRGLLRALLDRAWSDVLALTLLRHGEDSDAFGEQLAVTDQLLGRLPMGDRARLQQDVEAGLQQIGMHTEEAIQVAQRLLSVTPDIGGADQPRTTDLALRLKQHQLLDETTSTESASLAPVVAENKPPDSLVERLFKHLAQYAAAATCGVYRLPAD